METKIILREKTCKDGNGKIVLAKWFRGAVYEYVTWWMNDQGQTFHGHYFGIRNNAERDYEERN